MIVMLLCMYCAMCTYGVKRGHKSARDTLELKVRMAVIHHTDAGYETWDIYKGNKCY